MTRVGWEHHRLLLRRTDAMFDKASAVCDEILQWWLKPYTRDEERVAFVREFQAALRAGGAPSPWGEIADSDAATEYIYAQVNASVANMLVAALIWRRWQQRR